jgi:hypothetical protein
MVSLIANTFTNKSLKNTRVTKAPNTPKTPKVDKLVWKQPINTISKLYKIIFFAIRTPARTKKWKDCILQASDNFLYLIKDNNTY